MIIFRVGVGGVSLPRGRLVCASSHLVLFKPASRTLALIEAIFSSFTEYLTL